jgi:hypothetical protein
MSVLSNLLPGVRDLRAPLSTGYLWLVLGWVVFRDQIASAEASNQLVHDIHGAVDGAPAGVVAAGVTFCAYIVGALSVATFGRVMAWTIGRVQSKDWVARAIWTRIRFSWLLADPEGEPQSRRRDPQSRRRDPRLMYGVQPLPQVAAILPPGARAQVVQIVSEEFARIRTVLGDEQRESDEGERLPDEILELIRPLPLRRETEKIDKRREAWRRRRKRRWPPLKPLWWVPEDLALAVQLPVQELGTAVVSELSDFRTQLIQADPQLYNSYDRLASEGEFRWSIFPPLVAIILAVASETSAAWAVLLAGAIVLFSTADKRRARQTPF